MLPKNLENKGVNTRWLANITKKKGAEIKHLDTAGGSPTAAPR
jgi:hypothetical protein